MDGWISIHRKIMEHPDYFRESFTRMSAWIDLLLLANHKDSIVRVRRARIKVGRGSLILSQQQLAERWKWSRGKVKRFLEELIEDGQITLQKTVRQTVQEIEQQTEHETVPTTHQQTVHQTDIGISVITICNYDSYQGGAETDGQQTEQQTIQQVEQQTEQKTEHETGGKTDTYNKYNKINKLNNIIIPPLSPLGGNPVDQKKFDEFSKVWYGFKGKKTSLEADYKNFLTKTAGLKINFPALLKLSLANKKNIYFQSWLNTVVPKNSINPPAEENQKSCGKKGNEFDFVAEEFKPLVRRWLRYKTSKRQSYKDEDSLKAMYDRLIRLSGGNLSTATEIIEDAMANNYSGFFELKKDGNNERKGNGNIGKTIVPNTVAKRESTI